MANAGVITASKHGYAKSSSKWQSLINQALVDRGIDPDHGLYEFIIEKVFSNNALTSGNIGYTTIDSYVGLLQATDQLPVATKSRAIEYHQDRVNLALQGDMEKKLNPAEVWGGAKRESSSTRTQTIKSKWHKG